MPAKRPNQSGYRNALNRSRTPMNPGPGSAVTTQFEATPATALTDIPPAGNNANYNALFGAGGIVNNNPNMNFHPGSNATVNYAPINNFMVPEGHVPDHADSQGQIINSIMTLIGDRFISDALYDTQPKHAGCMLGTRESVLARIYIWIRQNRTRIFWLAGMAGTGKTSIAVTLCRILWDDPTVMFIGSFFCSRSAGSIARTEVRNIIPTLAATLAAQYPEFAVALAAGLKEDPRATQKPVSDQLQVLLVSPFEMIASLTCPIILVIDGLDECSDEREVGELLTAIADLKINLNVKFVVTSRPEMHIRGTPISNPDHNTILQLHTIKEEEVTIDIRRYVTGTLEASATATTAAWYTNADVETLVRLSNGLFIFASTVLLYVLARERIRGRKERLHKVIYAATHGSAATESLDKVYEMIVLEAARTDKIDADELRATQRVLATILAARTPLSVLAMADLLETDSEYVRGSLERLHSVVYMPTDDNAAGVRALHASFGDYVVSRAADRVRLPATLGDEVLARGCFHVLSARLHFNISQSRSSYERNQDMKPDTFTLSLEYACLEWIFHIAGVSDTSVWDESIGKIFRVRFLFWLEVMSVLSKVRRAAAMLIFAATTVRRTDLASFLKDANKFVASSREAIERSAAHIYLSALPFAAKDSLIYQTFAPLCAGLIYVETIGVDQHGGRLMMTLTGHTDWVNSVDCSSDGLHVVSGSSDGTVRIWDIRTGEETMPPLNCGGGDINSVAFAPNGKTFAASTREGGVFTWNLSVAHASLRWKYPSTVSAGFVKFSPDGSLVASACGDGIVSLWQVEMGNIFTTLNCRDGKSVESVAFSPDGSKIASASGPPWIFQLWLVATSEPLGRPFQTGGLSSACMCFSPDGTRLAIQGQPGCVELLEIDNLAVTATIWHGNSGLSQILFSPDGRSIASASSDLNLYLSPASVEELESPPVVFSGHTDWVRSAAFSHDGLYIVSCSFDRTIRIWDTGGSLQPVQNLSTHSDWIRSVTTSSDDTFIVSGSDDRSVRVWDAHIGTSRLAPLLGHTKAVVSVAISQDSRMIASGSADWTVRLWDSQDGRAIGNPLTGHEDAVNSVAFSPDALWLISGSNDRTVRMWGVATGLPTGFSRLRCSERVVTVVFSPDGRIVAAGDITGRIRLWHADTGQLFCTPFQAMGNSVHSVGFSPDGTHIACGSGKDIIVWDVKTGRNVSEIRSTGSDIRSVIFSTDGTRTYSCSMNGTVRVLNALTGKLEATLQCQKDAMACVSLKPDGKSLMTCSADRTIRVWDLKAAKSRSSAKIMNPATVLSSATLKDGWLVSPSGSLLLWVPPEYRNLKHLQIWPCTMLIAEWRVVLTVGNEGWHRGTFWTSCWQEDDWKSIA